VRNERSVSGTSRSGEVCPGAPGSTLTAAPWVTFKYDPFGRRIEKISPATTSIFAYDGDNLVETVNSSGNVVARYTQGQNIDEPLAESRSGTVNYYEQDGLGSVTSLTAANGTVAQSYTYDSFGNTVSSSGSLTNYFRYTGRELDTETGLYYYRARYYDPSSGRFLSEDPVHFKAGANFYRYVNNNPALFSDPTGLCQTQKCQNAKAAATSIFVYDGDDLVETVNAWSEQLRSAAL
jgi:RHS repeat-associated protein